MRLATGVKEFDEVLGGGFLPGGVVLLAVCNLPVAEHATRLVKKALTGTGAAEKAQVAAMVARILPGCGPMGEDEADALAVAIAHAHLRTATQMRVSA